MMCEICGNEFFGRKPVENKRARKVYIVLTVSPLMSSRERPKRRNREVKDNE